MKTPAYRTGQKDGSRYFRENFTYWQTTGENLPPPVSPYNGAELSEEWQAGFASKAGKPLSPWQLASK